MDFGINLSSTMKQLSTTGLKVVTFLTLCLIQFFSYSQTTVTFTTNGNFTVPAGVTDLTVECWGGGGGGGRSTTDNAGRGGGGGGAYARSSLAVTPGQIIPYTVGVGGSGGNVTAAVNTGGNTIFGANLILAVGGGGVANNVNTAGLGGLAASCIGDIVFNGGNGVVGSGGNSGAGGGGAGSTQVGGNGAAQTGGSGGAVGGGTGGNGRTNAGAGFAGNTFGGGGGGGRKGGLFSATQNGGAGATGAVRITYTLPSCSGTPNAGTASVSILTGCGNQSVTVSATGLSVLDGISYQWQSSVNGGAWGDIAGATGTSHTAVVNSTTSFRLVTTCSNSGLSNTSNEVTYTVTCWTNPANTTVFACSGTFFDSGGSGGNYGNNQNYTYTFFPSTPGQFMQLTFTQFATESSTCGNDWDWLRLFNGNTIGAPALHPTPAGCVAGFRTGQSPMTLPFTVTSTAPDGSITVQFKSDGSTAAAGWTANLACVSPCAGTPSVSGTASISSSNACSGTSVTVTASGLSTEPGVGFQWYSATSAGGPWNLILGATNSTYTSTPLVQTFFKLVSTCLSTGDFTETNVVLFTPVSCSSENVPFNGSNLISCGTSSFLYDHGGPSSNYANNANGFTVLEATGNATISISGTFNTESGWDFVRVFSGVGTGGPLVVGAVSGNGTINYTGAPGQTLTVQFTSDGSNVAPGFALQVIYNGICAPLAPIGITTDNDNFCPGGSAVLTANGAQGTVYWFEGACATTGEIGTGNSITVSPATTTTYFARNFDNGFFSTTCASITINVQSAPTNLAVAGDLISCPGQTAILTASADPAFEILSATATYSLGNANTDFGFQSLPGSSSCPVPLSVPVPAGATVVGVDVQYSIEALTFQSGSFLGIPLFSDGWMSEQRSQLRCVSPGGLSEPTLVFGAGNTIGTFNYSRTGLNIANNVISSGNVNFELHAGRTFGQTGCNQNVQRVLNNTYTVTVYYLSPLPVTYQWSGVEILGASDQAAVTVQPSTTTTYTVTATSNTCSVSETFTVTPEDLTPPVPVCLDQTISLNTSGLASITAAQIDNGSTDNCGIASLTLSQTNFNCTQTGVNNVVLTVLDVNGNSATCSAIITVIDDLAPNVVCQNITLPLNASGNVSINAAQIDNGSSDNCGIVSMSVSPNTLDCSNLGANTITLTAVDASGNSSSCTATITLTDNASPTALCQNATIQLDATGAAVLLPGQIDAGSFDNCSLSSITLSQSNFNCSNVGVNNVSLQLTDQSGNSASCVAQVTVQDLIAPQALCQDINVELNASGVVSITGAQVDNGSLDACGIASLSVLPNAFNCSNVGSNSVILTVLDVNLNSSTCSATVTVQDNVDPTALCANISLQLDATGNVSMTPASIDNGSFDACGILSLSASQLTFSCSNVGINPVTLTVTDVNGNFSSCISDVTIIDDIDPIAICQDITVQLDVNGQATITGADINNGSSDACGLNSITVSPNTFDCSDVGTNPVVLTVVDVNGNSSTCNAIVTVEDNVDPVATCQNITVALDLNGNATITAADVDGGSIDACGIASLTIDQNTFTCSNVGTNLVTLTVTDENNNSSSCQSVVTVIDDFSPVFTSGPSDISLIAVDFLCGRVVTYPLPQFSDACGALMTQTDNTGLTTGDIFPVGTTVQTYTATDVNGNSAFYSFTITILDQQAPVITGCPNNIVVNSAEACSAAVNWVAPTASDNCPGVLLTSSNVPGSTFPVGLNNVSYTATDASGNVTNCSFTITVLDATAPIAPVLATANGECSVTLTVPSATDNCDGTITGTTTDPLIYLNQGTFAVVWTFTDSNGNSSTATQTVIVNDNTAPTITVAADVTVNANSGCSATGVVLGTPVTADNCAVATVTNNAPASYPVGTTTVTWTVTDVNGNSTTATQTVTVTDVIDPTITAPANVTVNANSSCAAFNVNLGTPVTNDNCSVISVTNDAPAVFTVGTTTVTWTVTDASGNTATAVQTITVNDTQAPVITAPANITVSAGVDCQATGVALGSAVASDNCSGVTVSNDAPVSFPVGTTTVTWIVTDASGNTATAAQTVTVIDNTMPTITAPSDVTVNANSGCSATGVVLGTPVTADNCTVASVTNNAPTTFPIGTTTVTWTVTDVNGNVTTAAQTVTVVDIIPPTIVAPANLTVSANSNCEAIGTFIGAPQINDNCGIASLENDAPAVFPIGTTTVTWTVTDLSGNTSQASHTITVVDESAPVAILNPFSVTLDNDGNASIEFSDVDGGSFDNCGIASVNLSPTEFDCANLGLNEVTVTLTDNSGNVTTSKVVVTVNSNGIDSDNDGIDDSCDPEFNEILPIIPEAFTPNGNGINDLFVIGNLNLLGDAALDVFNRHGLLVYSSPNYQNDWDGKRADNDQALPDGTYYYVLTLADKSMKGFVYINRVQK